MFLLKINPITRCAAGLPRAALVYPERIAIFRHLIVRPPQRVVEFCPLNSKGSVLLLATGLALRSSQTHLNIGHVAHGWH